MGHMAKGEMKFSDVVLKHIMEGIAIDFNQRAGSVEARVMTAPKTLEFVLASPYSRTEPVLWVEHVGAYVVASEAKSFEDSVRKAHAQACVLSSPLHRIFVRLSPGFAPVLMANVGVSTLY